MSITEQIRQRISAQSAGTMFSSADMLDIGSRATVDKVLSRMVNSGEVTRLSRGVYSRAAHEGCTKSELVEKVVDFIGKKTKIVTQADGDSALQQLGVRHEVSQGRSSQGYEFWGTAEKTINVCGERVRIKRVSPRKLIGTRDSVGLAVSAIWGLGKGCRTKDSLQEILDKLTTEECDSLLCHSRSLPGWAIELLNRTEKIMPIIKDVEEPSEPDGKDPADTAQSHVDLGSVWTPSSTEGRWCGFGPYYAMFPVDFARSVVERFCPPSGAVLDPFCGRGTVPFVAMATGRKAIGSDVNPVAWVFSKVKTSAFADPDELIRRAKEIQDLVSQAEMTPENEFQKWAWSPEVLGFLNSARRNLNWKECSRDRTLMGVLLVHLHAKLGEGLSNQMRQSKAMAPDYSVKWWQKREMSPPHIDIIGFLKKKLDWRYKKGVVTPTNEPPEIILGDSRTALSERSTDFKVDLIFTSPPYCGVTNYAYDNWIRLWLLGMAPALPEANTASRFNDKSEYQSLLLEAFGASKDNAKETAVVYVRTDAREFTLRSTIQALQKVWPNKNMFYSHNISRRKTQTALFGDTSKKPGEVDLLLLPETSNIDPGMSQVCDAESAVAQIRQANV